MSSQSQQFDFLWLVSKSPAPPTDGAKVASYNLLRGIKALGAQTAIVVIGSESEVELAANSTELHDLGVIYTVTRQVPSSSLGRKVTYGLNFLTKPKLPLTIAPFASAQVERSIHQLTATISHRRVVFDGLHVAAPYITTQQLQQTSLPYSILRAHNREALIWKRKLEQTTSLAARCFFSHQYRLVDAFEIEVARRASLVCTVSATDSALFAQHVAEDRLAVVPIGYEFAPPPPFPVTEPRRLLFVGRLDWPPNSEGLSWFLNEVWQPLLASGTPWHLTVVGSGSSDWLSEYRGLPQTEILGFVADLDPLYARSALTILPIFYGSGTRVKAIEAARFGRPCLSTLVGVEGLPLVSKELYFRAETREAWLHALNNLSLDELAKMGDRAREAMAEEFSIEGAARRFLTAVEQLPEAARGN